MAESSYRFGIVFPPIGSRREFEEAVRRVDEFGFDFVAVGDHLGRIAPFGSLAVAAAVSDRLRLRTYVLNVGFWNPALLAREAATLDLLSDGRLELGMGAGTIRSEFEQAGMRWRPLGERTAELGETVKLVRWRLADPGHQPQPVQRPIPLLIGAMSRRGLAVAAEHADTIGFAAIRQAEGKPPGALRAARAEETDELVAYARQRAGDRSFESDVLMQAGELGRASLATAKAFIEREGEAEDPQVLAESPCVLFAPHAGEAAAELERRRERWGFTSFTTFWPSADALAQVRAELA